VNQKNCKNNIPLHYACKYGNENIIKYLIDYGADESQCKYPYLPYLILSSPKKKKKKKNEDIVKYIEQQEITVNKNELLLEVFQYGNEKIVKMQIKRIEMVTHFY